MTRDYFAKYTGYRGNAHESEAVQAFYEAADAAGLDYATLTADDHGVAAAEAYGAAVKAAWPHRINPDPSFEGSIEVYPLPPQNE
jgi:hypothetical protein